MVIDIREFDGLIFIFYSFGRVNSRYLGEVRPSSALPAACGLGQRPLGIKIRIERRSK